MREILSHNFKANGPPVLFYRMVPHYRHALYEGLHKRIGLRVVAPQRDSGQADGLHIVERAPWLHRIPFRSSPLRHPGAPVKAVLRALRPATVIAEAGLNSPTMWSLLAHRKRHGWPRVLLWGHGWQMGRGFATPADWASQYGRLAPFRLADGYLAYSEEGAAYLRRHLPRLPVMTVGNSLDCQVDEAILTASIAATEAAARPLTLIAVGRFTPDKRMPDLVEMLAELRRDIPAARLILVGDGPDRERCRHLAASLPGEAIDMPGAIYDPAALGRLYAQADIACYAGSVGLAVNEALAHGLPFLALDGGPGRQPFHHPEIAFIRDGETGLRIPANGKRGCARMAVAIAALARDRRALADMRRKARAFYRAHLTIDRMVDRFTEAVRNMEVAA